MAHKPVSGSGLTTVRMPPELHKALLAKAHEQGVPLNAWMVALLAGGMNFRLPKGSS